jgi:hypothetical protein
MRLINFCRLLSTNPPIHKAFSFKALERYFGAILVGVSESGSMAESEIEFIDVALQGRA